MRPGLERGMKSVPKIGRLLQVLAVALLLGAITAVVVGGFVEGREEAEQPLAVGMNEPGREIEGPMALVIVGGLATSMALNLLVLPTLALQFGKFGVAGDPDLAAPAEPAKAPGVAAP